MNSRAACNVRRAPPLLLVALLLIGAATGCRRGASSPTAPSDPSPLGVGLAGIVTEATADRALPSARVEIPDGANHGTSTVADAEGRYVLADLQPGTFSIRAVADGFESESRSITLASTQTVNFALRRSATGSDSPSPRWSLSGVIKEGGAQVALPGARIEIAEGKNHGTSAVADAEGRYRLDALEQGAFALRVSADGFGPEWRALTLSSNQALDVVLTRTGPLAPRVTGRTLDGVSNQPLAGVMVRIDGLGEITSGSDGTFVLTASTPEQVRAVNVTSPFTVERSTRLRVPGGDATLTLIPTALNLTSFDEMFRGNDGELHRWVSAPRVVVERRVLLFTNVNDADYTATASVMSDTEVNDLLADLAWALPQLTGNAFGAFAEQRVETAAEGQLVSVARAGVIVVARYEGLSDATSFWGYTRWGWNARGEVHAGVLMLDQAFETSGHPFRRSLRAHELGHALGYNHVDARASVMNVYAYVEPNALDRDGARVAFLRPPLNRSPDVDPDPMTVNRLFAGPLLWSGAR